MSEKHITLENLKTVISPIKHLIQQNTDLIEKKSDWNELKNKPFYTAEDGTVHKISSSYIPGLTAELNYNNISFERKYSNFITSGGHIDDYRYSSDIHDSNVTSNGNIEKTRYGNATSSQAGSGGTILSSSYAQANGLGTVVNTNYGNAIGTYNNYFEFDIYTKTMTLTLNFNDHNPWYYTQTTPIYDKTTGLFELYEYDEYTAATSPANAYKFIKGDIVFNTPSYIQLPYHHSYYLITKIIEQSNGRAILEVVYHYTTRSEGVITGREGPYVHIVGNGTNDENRSNAHTLDWEGNAWYAGDIYVGSTSGTNKDDGSKKLATEEYVMNQINSGAKGTPFIQGSGTTDSTAKTSTWIGNSDEITEYYDGLAIRYKIGVAGQSTITLNINGLGAKTVYRFSTTKLTTQFPVGSIINLIYHTDLNDGCWMCNDYDANTNTYQRVYESSAKNVEYPITARYNTTSGTSYYAEYGRYSAGVTLNPSTNTITATNFKGNLTGTATKASQDSQGNVIVDTYATKNYVQNEFTTKALTLTGIDAEGISHTWTIYGVAQ